jgi:hypothetical protein
LSYKDISNELREVAAHYRFHRPPAFVDDFKEWLGKVIRSIYDFLHELFRHTGGAMDSRSMSALLQGVIYVTAVAACLIAVYWLWRKAAVVQKEAAESTRGASAVEQILNASGWRMQAEKLAAKADYRGACRAVYLSLLQNLDERGIAQFAPTKTNYEYQYLLASFPSVQKEFRALADLVETIWFGNRQAEQHDYTDSIERLAAMDRELERLAAQKKAAGAAVSDE